MKWLLGMVMCLVLCGCPTLGTKDFDAHGWEQQLDVITLNLQDAQDIAESAELKAFFARASEVTSTVSEALARYDALGGDEASKLDLLLAIESGLSELDKLLAENEGTGDMRAGVLTLKVALRQMTLYLKD